MLEVPFFCEIVGELCRKMDVYHMGIGMVSLNDSSSFTIEYDADPRR